LALLAPFLGDSCQVATGISEATPQVKTGAVDLPKHS
jgi:hypothetical protein